MKILLLEDRPERQKKFISDKIKSWENIFISGQIFMPEVNDCKVIIEQINNYSFALNQTFKLLIVHRSALKSSGISHLSSICKEKKIKLIYFSGGISQTIYNSQDFEQINLNSTDFYSDLLIPFLQNFITNDSISVLEIFHTEWKISYMMLYRQLLRNLELTEEDYDLDSDRSYILRRIEKIENVIGKMKLEELHKSIQQKINYL